MVVLLVGRIGVRLGPVTPGLPAPLVAHLAQDDLGGGGDGRAVIAPRSPPTEAPTRTATNAAAGGISTVRANTRDDQHGGGDRRVVAEGHPPGPGSFDRSLGRDLDGSVGHDPSTGVRTISGRS
jgi:hypothetical protein